MISVVIPLYNKGRSIAQTLECVLNQTFQDFEVVVVDDGSKDNSAAVVAQFTDTRIHLVRQANRGVSAARNRGIEEAQGEYVAFLDADDVWKENHLENLTRLIGRYPQCRAWASSYINNINGADHNIILNKMPFKGEDGVLSNYFEICSCSHPPVWSSAVCVEKTLLKEIGGFPIGITSGEDLLTWAKIAIKTDWAYSMKATAVFIQGEASVAKPRRLHDEKDVVGEELFLLLVENGNKIGLKEYVSLWHKMRSMTYLQSNNRSGAIRQAYLSIKYNPSNVKAYTYLIVALLPSFVIRKLMERYTR